MAEAATTAGVGAPAEAVEAVEAVVDATGVEAMAAAVVGATGVAAAAAAVGAAVVGSAGVVAASRAVQRTLAEKASSYPSLYGGSAGLVRPRRHWSDEPQLGWWWVGRWVA